VGWNCVVDLTKLSESASIPLFLRDAMRAIFYFFDSFQKSSLACFVFVIQTIGRAKSNPR
jgi:hypothetical protein